MKIQEAVAWAAVGIAALVILSSLFKHPTTQPSTQPAPPVGQQPQQPQQPSACLW